jgi:uncharacterized oxidoreductase
MDSHGVIRIPSYLVGLQEETIAKDDRIKVLTDQSAVALLDGQYTFGPVTASRAVNMALLKAQEFGIGFVAVRNSSHTGRLGEYVEDIARKGFVGFMCSNAQGAGQLVAPWGAKEPRLSTNPMAWGVPTGSDPMVLDMATSAASEGKIRVKLRRQEKIPAGWAIDANGYTVTDPSQFYGPPIGAILSAGHKGYGLALVVEVLAGALTGGGCVRPIDYLHTTQNSFVVMAIDINLFHALHEFTAVVDGLLAYVKTASPLDPDGKVLFPNEPEINERRRRLAEGIPLDDETWQQIVQAALGVGIEVECRNKNHAPAEIRWHGSGST